MNEILVAAMLSLLPKPPANWTETPDVYTDRVGLIASVIAADSTDDRMALAVVTVFWFESRFKPEVHSGERRGDGGRAICLGQHQHFPRVRSREAWSKLAGKDALSTQRCVAATRRLLEKAMRVCQARAHRSGLEPTSGDYRRAFSLYGTGNTCSSTDRKFVKRDLLMRKFVQRFNK